MAEKTKKRKADHIRIATTYNVQARKNTTGLEDVHFIHKALPEVDREKIGLSTIVFNHRFAAPIMVSAITGGTREARKINATIATVVEEFGLGMGVGSQRAALEDKRLEKTFAIVRKKSSYSLFSGEYWRSSACARLQCKRGKESCGND
ncbi:MAG: alpha-hydroxy-acid oxidizing protein [Candidatus Bathyarchaeales archaeon]